MTNSIRCLLGLLALSTALAQSPPSVVVNAVSGSSAAGVPHTFTFTFSDPAGASNITSAEVTFAATFSQYPACDVVYAASSGFWLNDDSTNGSIMGPLPANQAPESVSNSLCTLSNPGVSISGNQLTLTMTLTFTAAFGGAKGVWAMATNSSSLNSGWIPDGSWTAQLSTTPPTISYINTSRSNSNTVFEVAGDHWEADIIGGASRANQPILVAGATNGVVWGPFPKGTTDGNGNQTFTGAPGASVGYWTETWYVNGVAATPTVGFSMGPPPSVSQVNLSRPGNNTIFWVGDRWQITVTGAPYQTVSLDATCNGSFSGGIIIGITDANGNLTLTGQRPSSVVGNWVETWYVGGQSNPATPVLTFSVIQTYTIGGQVTSSPGVGLGNVNMTLGGSATGSVLTDSSGNYSFTGVPAGGNYTVSVAMSGYNFGPAQSFNTLSGNQTANFGALPPSVTLIGPADGSMNLSTPLTLSWSQSVGATGYDVYLGTSNAPIAVFASNVSGTSLSASGLSGGTLYYWTVAAKNTAGSAAAPTARTFTTAPPLVTGNTLDGRRVGVKSTGSYWGAAGEQIDLLSGNLNYSIPLIHAKGLGSGATFALSYNSQIWRQNGGTPTLLGRDTGFGLGWTLQAGSLLLVSNSYYLFTDSTGAQYTLDQNSNGVWTSRDGTYAAYDSNAHRLYFPDGSFWNMTVQSVAPELDAGTLYPQSIQDSNGNSIQIQYDKAVGSNQANTSGRIKSILDARDSHSLTYTYLNSGDAFPHLTSVSDLTGSGESYWFTYGGNQANGWSLPLSSPFDMKPFGAATVLQGITLTGLNTAYTLQYGLGTGELTQVTTSLGGTLTWAYHTYAYGSGLRYREVQTRQMSPSAGPTYSWNIVLDSNPTLHASATVADVGAGTSKVWNFVTSGAFLGLSSSYEERDGTGTALLRKGYTWAVDFGNVYVGSVVTTQNPGANQVQSKSTQTVDVYGNITQSQAFDYGNLNTPARTYDYDYLADPNYTSRYIRNRLTSVTLNSTTTLVTNTYDAYAPGPCSPVTGLTARTGLLYHDDTNYGTSFVYRGNVTYSESLGSATCTAYETTGVAVAWKDRAGHTYTSTPSDSAHYALPGVLTPGGNSDLATTVTYSRSWAVTSVIGPNGATGSTVYDEYGRPQSNTIPDGAVTNYTYAYTGVNGATANQQTATLGSGAGARWKRTTMDGFGRVTRVGTGHDSTTVSQVDTQYAPCACSPLGKLSQTSQPYTPNSDGTVPSPDPRVWTRYQYDASGRTTSVTAPAPDNSVTTYAYSGNQTTVTDPAGKSKTSVTDAFGNLIQVIEPGNLITNYTYNNLNQLTDVSMTRSTGPQTRHFVYTGTDMTSATNPENGTVQYQYDTSHRVTQRTDNMGQQTRYIYDTYGRLTQVQHWAGSPLAEVTSQQVNYWYDTNTLDPSYSKNTWGRLAAVQFQLGFFNMPVSYEYSYNQAGRVINQRMIYPKTSTDATAMALDMTAAYTWDNEGRMTSLAYPRNGPVFNYAFDAMGRLNTMTSGGTTVSSATYGVAGELQTLTYDSYSETRTYNSLFQLTGITSAVGMDRQMDMQYVYDTNGHNTGRITQATDGSTNETVNYLYDPLNRLESATASGWSQGFTYDGFGNLTGKTGTGTAIGTGFSAQFDAATNHQIGGSYDGNGNNLMGGGGSTPTPGYDVENRMVSETVGGTITFYTYDPKGKRVAKVIFNSADTTTSGQEVYFYGIGGQKLMTVQCTQNTDYTWSYTATTNVYFGGKLIRSNGVTVATDRLGSVRANSAGERMSYYPYGEEKTPATPDGREKFGTYFRDSTTQDYADQRYYGVGSGRFNTPDPALNSNATVLPGNWNRYAYVGGDPINKTDPWGLCSPEDDPPCFSVTGTGSMPGSGGAGGGSITGGAGYFAFMLLNMLDVKGEGLEYAGVKSTLLLQHERLNQIQRRQAVDAINNLGVGCKDAFQAKGFTAAGLSVIASGIEFYSTAFEGDVKVGLLAGNSDKTTLKNYVDGRAATVGNDVILGGDYFTKIGYGATVAASQNITLVHEALHVGTGQNDAQLYQFFGLSTFPDQQMSMSGTISQWLSEDCPHGQ